MPKFKNICKIPQLNVGSKWSIFYFLTIPVETNKLVCWKRKKKKKRYNFRWNSHSAATLCSCFFYLLFHSSAHGWIIVWDIQVKYLAFILTNFKIAFKKPWLASTLASYPGCNGAMFLPFIVDHPDPCLLEHVLHLLWSSRGGEVHILGRLPGQQVPHCAPSDPQLILVFLKHL